MTSRILILVLGWTAICPWASEVGATEGNRFRGNDGNGRVEGASHPATWSAEDNVGWSLEIAGGGWSSPIVSKGRAYLTTAIGKDGAKPKNFQDGVRGMSRQGSPTEPVRFEVWCIDLSEGTVQWKSKVSETVPKHSIHPSNTYATESPAFDGDQVYVFFGSIGVVACLDESGNEVWRKDIGVYPMNANFGTGSSPVIFQGLLFVQSDNNESSFLLALDKKSGKEIWRKKRPTGSSWSTPILWKSSQGDQLVACGPGSATSYDPSTGKILWNLTEIEGSFTASPIYDRDRVYFGNSGPGSRGPLIAVKAEASGEILLTEEPDAVAWVRARSGPGMASPVLDSGFLYVMGSGGILDCYKAETGDRVYRERISGMGSVVSSLWASGGKVFILDESGQAVVVKRGADFELISRNEISDLFWSTPSVAGKDLLLRGANKIYCVRSKAKEL